MIAKMVAANNTESHSGNIFSIKTETPSNNTNFIVSSVQVFNHIALQNVCIGTRQVIGSSTGIPFFLVIVNQ